VSFIEDVSAVRQRARQNIERGAVTPELKLDPEKICSVLNEALATELVCILRYQHHY
jgi:bacterioferritin